VPEPAAEDSAASAAAGVDAAIATLTIPLVFSFAAESWAEVTDARGERLLFGLNAAGRTVTVRGEPPFAVVLGNADSVALTVDGEPYQIPRTGRQGNLARFAVDIAEE
jgi:cytoskeleton protein RodZ